MKRELTTMGLLLLLACGKDEAKTNAASASSSAVSPLATSASPAGSFPALAGAAPSAAASAPAADAPPPPKCPPGLSGNSVPAYCIKLPSGYTVKQSRISTKRGSIEYDTGTSTDNLMITYDDSAMGSLSKDVESEMKFGGDKLEKKGDLPGGGRWFRGTHAEYARVVTIIKGQGSVILKCSFAYQSKKAPPKEAIETCKSIVVP